MLWLLSQKVNDVKTPEEKKAHLAWNVALPATQANLFVTTCCPCRQFFRDGNCQKMPLSYCAPGTQGRVSIRSSLDFGACGDSHVIHQFHVWHQPDISFFFEPLASLSAAFMSMQWQTMWWIECIRWFLLGWIQILGTFCLKISAKCNWDY